MTWSRADDIAGAHFRRVATSPRQLEVLRAAERASRQFVRIAHLSLLASCRARITVRFAGDIARDSTCELEPDIRQSAAHALARGPLPALVRPGRSLPDDKGKPDRWSVRGLGRRPIQGGRNSAADEREL